MPEDASTAELMEHYATVINISHSIEEAGDTIYIDQSVNQNIEAYGDVNQSFDQAAVTGDGAVLAGDGSQVNTGEGAVQAGGDVEDSTVATGDVGGSVTGDNEGSTVGDGNAVISDSEVGSAAFGEGTPPTSRPRTPTWATARSCPTPTATPRSTRDGDLNDVDGSTLSETSLGDGDVYSDDATAIAEGSSLAFGDGSTSSAEDQDTTIDDNYGNANVADDGDQTADLDASTNDSFNTEGSFLTRLSVLDGSTNGSENTYDSGNEDLTFEDNSGESTETDASDDDYTYNDSSASDDDGTDADVDGIDFIGSRRPPGGAPPHRLDTDLIHL